MLHVEAQIVARFAWISDIMKNKRLDQLRFWDLQPWQCTVRQKKMIDKNRVVAKKYGGPRVVVGRAKDIICWPRYFWEEDLVKFDLFAKAMWIHLRHTEGIRCGQERLKKMLYCCLTMENTPTKEVKRGKVANKKHPGDRKSVV